MLHREQACGGTVRGVDLRVDVLGVVGDCLRGDHQPLSDPLVGQAPREQPEDLDLARRQARRALAAPRDAVSGGAEHGLDGFGVVAARLDVGTQLGGGLLGGALRAVGTGLAHRLVGVRGGKDARLAGDPGTGEPARVAGAVEALPVLHGDPGHRRQRLGLAQHAIGQIGLKADALPLACAERSGLVQDGVRDPEPPEAMHETGAAQESHVGARPVRPSCPPLRRARTPPARAQEVRRLQVDEVGDRQERGVEALARQHDGERRLGVDDGIPHSRRCRDPTG